MAINVVSVGDMYDGGHKNGAFNTLKQRPWMLNAARKVSKDIPDYPTTPAFQGGTSAKPQSESPLRLNYYW